MHHVSEWPKQFGRKQLSRSVTHARPQIDLRLTNLLFVVRSQIQNTWANLSSNLIQGILRQRRSTKYTSIEHSPLKCSDNLSEECSQQSRFEFTDNFVLSSDLTHLFTQLHCLTQLHWKNCALTEDKNVINE